MPPEVALDDLRRVDDVAMRLFAHDYLDEGLGAVGLFLQRVPSNAGYRATPVNSVTFGGLGVDGIHFGSVTTGAEVDPQAPVVLTNPVAFDDPNPNVIVGESLWDFLCLGRSHGFANLANLPDVDAVVEFYSRPPGPFEFDPRIPHVLDLMAEELDLQPWKDVRGRFADLRDRFVGRLEVANP